MMNKNLYREDEHRNSYFENGSQHFNYKFSENDNRRPQISTNRTENFDIFKSEYDKNTILDNTTNMPFIPSNKLNTSPLMNTSMDFNYFNTNAQNFNFADDHKYLPTSIQKPSRHSDSTFTSQSNFCNTDSNISNKDLCDSKNFISQTPLNTTNINRSVKGLKHFSRKVFEKLSQIKISTYNEISGLLISDYVNERRLSFYNFVLQASEEKNIRRRIYDSLNVLTAMGIIAKEKKKLRQVGLDYIDNQTNKLSQDQNSYKSFSTCDFRMREGENSDTHISARISRKREELSNLILQYTSLCAYAEESSDYSNNKIEVNTFKSTDSTSSPTRNSINKTQKILTKNNFSSKTSSDTSVFKEQKQHITLPFLIINSESQPLRDENNESFLNMKAKNEISFEFLHSFGIHDDAYILREIALQTIFQNGRVQIPEKMLEHLPKNLLPLISKTYFGRLIESNFLNCSGETFVDKEQKLFSNDEKIFKSCASDFEYGNTSNSDSNRLENFNFNDCKFEPFESNSNLNDKSYKRCLDKFYNEQDFSSSYKNEKVFVSDRLRNFEQCNEHVNRLNMDSNCRDCYNENNCIGYRNEMFNSSEGMEFSYGNDFESKNLRNYSRNTNREILNNYEQSDIIKKKKNISTQQIFSYNSNIK